MSFPTFKIFLVCMCVCGCSAVECELYIAQSTIPNAGLGIFSAIERQPGDGIGEGDVCLPLFDPNSHHGEPFNPFEDYVWLGEDMGMHMEIDSVVTAFCPGLDCAINCNLALVNVDKSDLTFDTVGLHRALHPGAGANTPYHNATTKATRKIPAGGELFKSYGDNWFATREDFNSFPLTMDFPVAKALIDKLFRTRSKDHQRMVYEDIVLPIKQIWNSRTVNALPATFEEARIAKEHDIGMVFQPNSTRSVEWLQKNGRCIDNIYPGVSTIEGAGHGAFAKRDIPKDSTITGSPLHHIPFKNDFMPMYRTEKRPGGVFVDKSEITGQQVVMNYCFGHPESSLLLCPYGLGINYINHNQTQANVKVVWSRDGITSHDDRWLSLSPKDMEKEYGGHLAMDYVATRDILQDEELFLDYGDLWEKAWQDHVKTWESRNVWSELYVNARAWNNLMGSTPIRTSLEAATDPYPANLQIRCHQDLEEGYWRSLKISWLKWDYGYPCEILARTQDQQGQYSYKVRMTTETNSQYDVDSEPPETLVIEGVPKNAIRFFDVPHTTDLLLLGTFRYPIGLPEELMQAEWRNDPAEKSGQS